MSARSIVMLGLMMIFPLASFAQSWPVSWMAIPSAITPSGFMTNLPGYSTGTSKDVLVTFSSTITSSIVLQPFTNSFVPSGFPVGPYAWGASATNINIYNGSLTGATANYTITFTFKGTGPPPDPRKLLLAIVGLESGTNVNVSQPGVAQSTSPPTLLQYTFNPIPIGGSTSSPTLINTTSDTPCSLSTSITGQCVSSGYTAAGGTDPRNTGWALFQATGPINVVGGHPTLSVNVSQLQGDGIGFTLGYATVPDACCPPFDKNIMLQQLVLTQPGGVTGPITYSFTNSAPYKTQMQDYLNYLHSVNSAITSLSVEWNVSDLGPSGPGTSPAPTGPPVPPPALTTWGAGGTGKLTYPTGPEPSGGYPIITGLQPNEWYGFTMTIYLNDSIQFWMESCSSFTATFTVYADPASLVRVGDQNLIAVEIREPGTKSGRVVMLPLNVSGEGPRN